MSIFRYFHPLSALQRRQAKYIESTVLPDNISKLISSSMPEFEASIADLTFLVLDIETTGFDPHQDMILSMGCVELHKGRLLLDTSWHTYINDASHIKAESAVINHITPEMLNDGISLDEAMAKFIEKAQGKILVAHGMTIEKRFLNKYFKRKFGLTKPPLIWLDTLKIEKSMFANIEHQEDGDYRLNEVRKRHGLPEYPGHNALLDAISTGELLMALVGKIFGQSRSRIDQLYKLSQPK